MPTALLTRAALLACVTLACSPKSGETETAPTTSTTDPGTSTTVSQPGTSGDPSSPMPHPTTSTTTTTGEDTGPVGQCALEHDVPDEECDWFYTGYSFDPMSQTCQSFGYGDCGTPVVPFETLEECLVECEGCETDCSTSSGSSSG
ncbi:BPTI/Kunitz-type proteinase inhibitor domain-containing protein [Nannocystis radixulma]|uniref:BPTI/Kunitz-type proteinase inhibitor domain-containing protein n=1 Tax=Nannocystis radixulma TaxID=2995305 RepID=A0ABT5B5W2_9BACT|nr:BPTI/Kunitz-type proteinase inhibitor domain-containing protein [Nannocystis radixulma]MDC0668843.1 BPTI/Kunitz-type proteinase inhibitor domain-containing protein [Nannocystis radixulma]